MTDQEDRKAARAQLERIRQGVRTVPHLPGAPEWLNSIEDMYEFFNSTARVWDGVFAEAGQQLYSVVGECIEPTDQKLHILDIGCGTGLELKEVFARVPNARITAIDLAPEMLRELQRKYSVQAGQLRLVAGSYLDLSFEAGAFDYVIATLTVHHVAPAARVELYRKIRSALKRNGRYIEGDQSTSVDGEKEVLHWYDEYIGKLPGGNRAQWNYDVTLSPETQRRLLREAGFESIELIWEQRDQTRDGLAVFTARPAINHEGA